MSKPSFSQLTRQELKSYIRQHPTDDEAVRELFVNRRSPDAKVFPPPSEMTKEELENIFKQKMSSSLLRRRISISMWIL
ncbi:hypothetical protein IQ218_11785 [Synechocystis salina LEGE 06099]|uniref:DUF6887 family protein n=1 Tax=Synechocystis salina TaxID=945780 RepID=UPI0018802B22|nr:hypothetical protein [Synechocystis salina]MBE9203995.1 hypothetical protein [Synechocystis salina LEGE 06099]